MGELGPDGFSEFFRALNGNQYDPFPWQMRLAERVIDGEWPSVIALPTSSGKTACIDIAVYALACQADLPVVKRTAPRRIFFVIDRRVVVDEAYERAKGIAHRLLEAKNGIIRTVADKLRQLACGDEPLACFQLRGGIYRDDSWARTPVQPSVIASTVDQIGSRILFRGYGLRSGYMWPIHAGLAGNDSLIILDEAHCAVPFKETMESVYKYRKWAFEPLKNPFAFVMMTATPPSEIEEADIFSADSFDQEHIVLGKRLDSKKPTKLVVAKNAKGDDALKHLAHELAEQALDLVQDGRPTAVGIIANRVSIAKMVHDELSQRSSGDVVLLIGGMRGLDRDKVVGKWLGKLNATEAATRQLNRPVFVVATQCLEVGANFDFDFLVSECASLDALRQRFGRLNRTGRDIRAAGVIVIRADQVAPKIEDPIYGQALAATWKWLCDHSGSSQIDMGINSLSEVFNAELAEQPNMIESLQQPARHAPVMLPTYVDFFAQTAPAPAIDPDPSLFLHGIKNSRPEVQVVWRSDIDPESDDLEAWVEAVSLCPPTSGEYMLVPINTIRNWFKFRDNPSLGTDNDLSDVMAEQPDSRNDSDLDATFHLLRWNGPQQSEFITSPANIRPGDTIIIPSKMGGWDFMGHIPPEHAKPETVDRGDEAHLKAKSKSVARLNAALLQSWPGCSARTAIIGLVAEPDLPEDLGLLRNMLLEVASCKDCPDWLSQNLRHLASDKKIKLFKHPFQGMVIQGSKLLSRSSTRGSFTDEDDSSSATVRIGLEEHSRGVAALAKKYAEACGLPETVINDLYHAGFFHDMGKADPRFQIWLCGGDKWLANSSEPLAKSNRMPKTFRDLIRAQKISGYPSGGRHEFLSVRLLESSSELISKAYDAKLLLHLIASHHGRCRPFAPVIDDSNPVQATLRFAGCDLEAATDTRLERLDSGTSERFWELIRRYGWWGLSYLEAILRLADHRRSEEEQVQS